MVTRMQWICPDTVFNKTRFYITLTALAAFATLLVVLVHTLPRVLLAGVIALGGLWLANHIDNSLVRLPPSLWAGSSTAPPSDRQ